MWKRVITAAFCSAIALSGASGLAIADTIGRYECNVIGTTAQEPVGDRDGHSLVSFQYSCFGVDGLLKGAVVTAISVSEWDGPKGTYLASVGVHRASGGEAVGQLLEGSGAVVIKDGRPIGTEAWGKTIFRFGAGTLASLSGKTVKFISKPAGPGRFTIEFTD